MITTGQMFVFGVPPVIRPIEDLPPGAVRLRFRNRAPGSVFVRTETGIRQFTIFIDRSGDWRLGYEIGRNYRLR